MELNDIEVGDVIVALFIKSQDGGNFGNAYIYLGSDRFFQVARVMENGKWKPKLSNYSYNWEQVSMVLGGVQKGTYEKVTEQKIRFAIIKVFDPKRTK